MGTRGPILFVWKGKLKAFYNRFDSYAEGLGEEIAKFLMDLSEEDVVKLVANLDEIEWCVTPYFR